MFFKYKVIIFNFLRFICNLYGIFKNIFIYFLKIFYFNFSIYKILVFSYERIEGYFRRNSYGRRRGWRLVGLE